MAKQPQDDSKEIKDMLQKLFHAVKDLKEASSEQKRVSRELMKVMSLLNSGFIENAEDANKLIESIRDNGLTVTDEFIKKWGKARKVTEEDLKNIAKRFKEIEELNDDVIDSARDYTDLLEDQIGSIETTIDLSAKLLQNHKRIAEAIQASKKQAAALAGSTGDLEGITNKILQKKVDLSGMFSSMFDGMSDGKILVENIKSDIDSLVARAGRSDLEINLMFNPLSNDLDKQVKEMLDSIEKERTKRLQGLQDYYAKNTELQDKMAKSMAAQDFAKNVTFDVDTSDITVAGKLLEKGTSEYQKVLKSLTKIVKDNDLGNKVNNSFEKMIGLMTSGVELTESQVKEMAKYKSILGDANKLLVEEFNTRLHDLEALKQGLISEKSRLLMIGEYTNQLSAARGVVEKIGQGFEYINSLLPTGVSEFFGISQVSQSLLDAHTKGVEKFAKHVADGGDLTKSMSVYMSEIGPSIQMALNPMLLLAAAGALLFSTLKRTIEVYKDMAATMKVSIKQAADLHNKELDILTSQKNQFTTMEDIQAIHAEMIESGKSIYMLNTKGNKELTIGLSEVGKAFGYGVEQAAKLQNTFTNLGANDEFALSLQTSLGFMAEAAGLSPQIISDDLLDAADEVATYFAGMPEQAAKAALGVRKMGMSLKKAGEIAHKMLDLEGFMTDMYELQAMTGGGIDFSKAFDKGLVGDIEGMTKEIMQSIGTTAEFNKMDYLTRTKIAKTLGMSSEELGRSVKLNEQLLQFQGAEKAALEENKDRLGDISKLNKDQIRDRLQQLQSTDRLSVAWDKIKGVLLKAIIPLAESFAGVIDAISPIIDIIIGALKVVSLIIRGLVPLVKGILIPFKLIGDILSGITSKFDEWADAIGPINTTVTVFGQKFDLIKDTIYGIGAAIGTWMLIFKLPALLGSVVGMFKNILSFIPGVSTIFSSLTGGFGGMFGSMSKKSKEAAKESTDPVINMTSKIESSMTSMIDRIKLSMDGMVTHIKTSMSSAQTTINKEMSKSPTSKMMAEIRRESAETTSVVSSEAEKSSKKMKKEVTEGSKVVKKRFGEIRDESSNIISNSGVKKSFGMMSEIGTRTLAVMAAKSVTSFLFAAEDGKQQLTGMGAEIQGVIELAAIGGSSFLADSLQKGMESVFAKKMDKKFGKSLDKMSTKTSKKLVGSFAEAADAGSDMFSKVSSEGEKTIGKVSNSGSLLQSLSDTIKKVWGTIKSTVLDILKFLGDALKTITSAIGESIKNLLKGIGDGLSSFSTNAVKGAAALLIISGALWVTSKALQNFASVSWESVAKGAVALGGLTLVAMALGGVSGQVIIGAAAIAILGASLIPAAYALNMFNDVNWSSLGKAGVALVGLAVAAGVLGAIMMSGVGAVALLLGAAAIAVLGASLLPLAAALAIASPALEKISPIIVAFGGVISSVFNGIATVISTSAKGIVDIFNTLTNVNVAKIMGIGPALMSVSAGFAALSASMAGGSIVSGISKLFGGDIIQDLERISNLTEPLNKVNQVISQLAASILELSNVLATADLDSIKKLNDIDVKSLDQDINQRLNTISGTSQGSGEYGTNYKVSPQQIQTVGALPPKKESVAQNVRINTVPGSKDGRDGADGSTGTNGSVQNSYYDGDTNENTDIYNRPGAGTKRLEMLLMRLIQLQEAALQKETAVVMNAQKVGTIIKKGFNN